MKNGKPPADSGVGRLIRRELALRAEFFRPPPKLTVSQWADQHRVLTRVASAEPGRWRTSRTPFAQAIMDAFSDPHVETVVVEACAQLVKTECVLNVIGYYMDQDPAPILVIQPSVDPMAKAFSKDRLGPMIRECDQLRGKVKSSNRRGPDDTILHKVFPGGHITIAGANSAAGLASRPIRVLLCDEVDRYPASAGVEGDPVSLGRKRTTTFWNRKIGMFSTPTIRGASRIDAAYQESDVRLRYHVPCPHCGHAQWLRWAQVNFDDAAYVCESCAAFIAETAKPAMLDAGQWIDEKTGRVWPDGELTARVIGFHLNALYSPWATWRELIKEFLTAKNTPERLRVFTNTVLAETWEVDGEGVDTGALSERREIYAAEVPAAVGVLTAAVDVQKDRLELAVKGWGAGQESWLIAHHRLYGDPSQPGGVWDRLDALLTKRYQHEAGAALPIQATCIDSGNWAQSVYAFVRPRRSRGVFATKGYSVRGKPIIGKPGSANRYGVRVIPIGTDTAKDVVFARLSQSEPGHPGYAHFPKPQQDGADDEYLRQFGAEEVFIRYSKGVPFREYRQIRDRNEAIDLEVLSLAALHLLGAGVYDQLALWAEKARAAGAAAQPATVGAETPAAAVAPLAVPRAPRSGGWVNRWRR